MTNFPYKRFRNLLHNNFGGHPSWTHGNFMDTPAAVDDGSNDGMLLWFQNHQQQPPCGWVRLMLLNKILQLVVAIILYDAFGLPSYPQPDNDEYSICSEAENHQFSFFPVDPFAHWKTKTTQFHNTRQHSQEKKAPQPFVMLLKKCHAWGGKFESFWKTNPGVVDGYRCLDHQRAMKGLVFTWKQSKTSNRQPGKISSSNSSSGVVGHSSANENS